MSIDRWAPWERWRTHPGTAGVLTDFDGTLAPIVDNPDEAVALAGSVDALRRLTGRYPLVGVISGRPVSYLVEHLAGVDGLVLVGLYGLERAIGPHIDCLPEAEPWREKVEVAARAAEAGAPPGARVERKGLAVTLHIRNFEHLAGWIEATAAEQAAATGLVAHPGRQSIELRPPVGADKGTVVEELAAGLDAVCFFGDDRGDLAAFEALAHLRAAGTTTVSVAVRSEEMPPELADAADLVVAGPEGVLETLTYLGSAGTAAD